MKCGFIKSNGFTFIPTVIMVFDEKLLIFQFMQFGMFINFNKNTEDGIE